MHRAVDIKANGTNASLCFKVAMNVIKTEPDSSSDSSLSGSEAVENSEEDSLGVMLPDVKLETEVRCNLLFFLYVLQQACSTFYIVQATLAKFCVHAGTMKFNTRNEE